MAAVMILGFVVALTTGLTINVLRNFNRTSTNLEAGRAAMVTLQRLNRELEEAKDIELISSTSIRVYYPEKTLDGNYNSALLDSANYVDYYLVDAAGNLNKNGSRLLKKKAGGAVFSICESVCALEFVRSSPSTLSVKLVTEKAQGFAKAKSSEIEQIIYLRNSII